MDVSLILAKAGESLSGGRSFGPAFEHDGVMVIPVAYVLGGAGGGEDNREKPGEPKGPASGGGFGMVSVPLGAWVIKNGDVRWAPSYDVTFLIMTVGGLLRGLSKARRRRKELRP